MIETGKIESSELREACSADVPPLAPPDFFDPVIEAYKKDVDRTLFRENLKLSPLQRLRKLESYVASALRLRGAAKRSRAAARKPSAGQ